MKNNIRIIIYLLISFVLGFGLKTILPNQSDSEEIIHTEKTEINKAKKVTGIGGIIFKSKDPVKLKAWYNKYLGLDMDEYGTQF